MPFPAFQLLDVGVDLVGTGGVTIGAGRAIVPCAVEARHYTCRVVCIGGPIGAWTARHRVAPPASDEKVAARAADQPVAAVAAEQDEPVSEHAVAGGVGGVDKVEAGASDDSNASASEVRLAAIGAERAGELEAVVLVAERDVDPASPGWQRTLWELSCVQTPTPDLALRVTPATSLKVVSLVLALRLTTRSLASPTLALYSIRGGHWSGAPQTGGSVWNPTVAASAAVASANTPIATPVATSPASPTTSKAAAVWCLPWLAWSSPFRLPRELPRGRGLMSATSGTQSRSDELARCCGWRPRAHPA